MRWAAILLAVALGLGGSLAIAGSQRVSFTVRIDSGSAEVGGQTTVNLDIVDIEGEPGVGAWTIDVTYDPAIVSVVDCLPGKQSICNPELAANTLRATGTRATRATEDIQVAAITFRCDETGSSDLTLVYQAGDAIDFAVPDGRAVEGTVTCRERGEPTAIADTEATPELLPSTGAGVGGTSESGVALWLLVALVGLAAVALFAALRLRPR